MKSKLLLATESQIASDALKVILNQKGYEVETQNDNFLELSRIFKWDTLPIIILEENVIQKNQRGCIDHLEDIEPRPRCAFILGSRNASYIIDGIREGINGFVHKKSGIDDLLNCLKALEDGFSYISPMFSGRIARLGENEVNQEQSLELTLREIQIIRLIKENKTSKEIGGILNLSTKTVQNHRQNMCNKLGLKGRNRLFEYAKDYY